MKHRLGRLTLVALLAMGVARVAVTGQGAEGDVITGVVRTDPRKACG